MSIDIDFDSLDTVVYDGVEMKKVIINGAVVFEKLLSQLEEVVSGGDNYWLGFSTSITTNIMAFSCHGSNKARLYDRDGALIKEISTSSQYLGSPVCVDENIFLVSDTQYDDSKGRVLLYDEEVNYIKTILSPSAEVNNNFGISLSICANTIAIGDTKDTPVTNAGRVYLYDRDFTLIKELESNQSDEIREQSEYGRLVKVSANRVVVSAARENNDSGSIYIYNIDGDLIKYIAYDAEGSFFGQALSVDDNYIFVGCKKTDTCGVVSIYDIDGNFIQKMELPSSQDKAIRSMSITSNDNYIVIGTSTIQQVFIYDRDIKLVTTIETPSDTNIEFGQTVSLYDKTLLVSDSRIDDNNGKVYRYTLS